MCMALAKAKSEIRLLGKITMKLAKSLFRMGYLDKIWRWAT